jgi:hybrid polyketide synthase/nonribosomal peptide synthetase FtdB
MTVAEIRSWLIARIAQTLRVDPATIDEREPFDSYGLSSTDAVALSGELQELLGRDLSATLVYEYPTVAALARYLAAPADAAPWAGDRAALASGTPIAIIGIGCRFPGADSPAAYWRLLREGVDAIREVPPDRWDARAVYHPDPTVPGKSITRWGGFLDHVDRFDPFFFGISPGEAERMDPQQRLLLEVAHESLEDAGYPMARLAGSDTGVFVGISINEYGFFQSGRPELITGHSGTGNALSIAANRISYFYDLRGPSMAIDTACSSSLMSVHLACRSLHSGECRLALAGGVNVVLSPAHSIAFTKAGVLAPDGRCKVFDASADGYVRGEGAGLVVLKPLPQALADGDAIYAVIRGSAVHQDGRTNGLMAPSRESQEAVLRDAYRDAGVSPARVQYVEAHGTGTLLGDSIEARALGAVLGGGGESSNGGRALGSVKSNFGHLEAAAGIAGLIKVALALKERALPPSLHFSVPNPHIPFEELGLRVQDTLTPWPTHSGPAVAGVSSFGFGGTNVHAVLEEAPEPDGARLRDAHDSAAGEVLPLSAHTAEALVALARGYRDLVSAPRAAWSLRNLCASRRCSNHFNHRVALVAHSPDELVASLDGFIAGGPQPRIGTGRLAFVFSGQGSQWHAMGRELQRQEPVFRATLEQCDLALRPFVDWSLLEQLAADEQTSRLSEIDVLQPALFALQVALANLWQAWGVRPDAVVGHSMGEVAAAHIAGALTLEDAARVITARSRLLRRLRGLGGMAVVGLSAADTARALEPYKGRLSIAGSNSPQSTVVAGDVSAMRDLAAKLEAHGDFCSLVNVDVASHSPQTAPLGSELRSALEGLEPRPVTLPFVSTVTGSVFDRPLDAAYWARNLAEPVNFTAAIAELARSGHTAFLEISPHPVLQTPMQQGLGHVGKQAVVLGSTRRDAPERDGMLRSLAALYASGGSVDWTRFYQPLARPVPHPTYPWQRERFWLDATGTQPLEPTHPLLGQRVALAHDPSASVWQLDLHADHALFLRDHRVHGEVVLPAAAFVEIALAAGASASISETHALVDLELRRSLPLPSGAHRLLQVALVPNGTPDSFALSVHSRPAEAEPGAWTLHAVATFVPQADDAATDARDLAAILQTMSEEIPRDRFYEALAARGLDYGPTLRGMTQVWRHDGEALGRVGLPDLLLHESDRYQLHPAILDAAMQVLAATSVAERGPGNDSYVPVGCRRLRLYRRPASHESLWSHVVLDPGAIPGATDVAASVRLLDDSGRTVAALTGLRLARIGAPVAPLRDTWLYRVRWRQTDWPAGQTGSNRWLILGDSKGGGLAAALARQLEAHGQHCAVDQELTSPAPLDHVIYIASGDPASLLRVVQRGAARLWIVTRGTQPVLAGEPTNVAGAPVWGLGRTIGFELPELKCTLVDLDPALDASHAAALLFRQLGVNDAEDQVALRGDRRWVPRLARVTACSAARSGALSADASYLITGGLGGLGLAVAAWMIEQGARHMVLVGRSTPSTGAAAQVERMRAAGADVTIISADVSVASDVTALFEQMRAGMPPLRGVVHAAGVLDNAPLVDLDAVRLARVLAPKVDGAWNLHTATVHEQLDFFVLFSSAVSVLGSPGQGNYAAANTFLDVLAHFRHRQGLPAISINWGPWVDIGLVASGDFLPASARSGATGVKGITPERGLEAFARALRHDEAQLTVLPFDIANLLELYPTAARMPFFSEVGGSETHVARLYARPQLQQEYVAPRNDIERKLAELWRQTLRIDRVGVRDSFFELGGDSVLAAQIVTAAHNAFGVRLDLREAFQGGAFSVEHLAQRIESAGRSQRIVPRDPGSAVPLSFVQERQLFLELLDPLTAVNNLAMCIRIEGPVDLAQLAQNARRLISRHEALRTSFQLAHGMPSATIAAALEIDLGLTDLSGEESDRLTEALRLATLEAQRPFRLDAPPLLRVKTFRLASDSHVMVVVIHHTIADGWSLGVFLRELFAPTPLPPLPIQYGDFAIWQRQSMDGPLPAEQLRYWKQQLGGELPVLDLPIDHPRPARQTFAGATHRFAFPAGLAGDVKAISRRHDVTPFMTLVGAFQALLQRWCGQDDILVGTATAGRSYPETEGLIGAFINTLVLRTDLSGDPSFAALLARVRAVALAAYAHQELPFEQLVAELRPQRDLSRTPVFQVMCILQNTPLPTLPTGQSLALLPLDRGAAQFDLTLIVTDSADGLEGAFEYNTDLFDASTIERLADAYRLLLEDAVTDPVTHVSRLRVMQDMDRRHLVTTLNDTHTAYPRDARVHELFEAQAARTPTALAIICGDRGVTYAELDQRASALATQLSGLGVGPDIPVGVCLERSVDLAVALLAVQKAGGAYLPIDPATPTERIQFMLHDAGALVLVSEDGVRRLVGTPDGHRPSGPGPDNLVYVIYTSGSTGEPKGVCVRHRALVNVLCSMRELLRMTSSDRLLAVTSLSFDIAALELYLPLISGATVVLATREMTQSARQLHEAIESYGVTVMQATPATWRLMLQGGWQGAPSLGALCGGEALTPDLAEALLARTGRLWNLYGPTETTVWSAAGAVRRGQLPITIGQPIANTQLHILDAQLQPVPIGVRGELYIGGDGVSPGYLNRPALTAERFVVNPFAGERGASERLFRTGDRARRLADGSIEVIGRLDNQVKIHGFRIELGEIEAALQRHPNVRGAAVIARSETLVAYVVPATEGSLDSRELRAFLHSLLPAYMLPAVIVSLPALPLTRAGKVDRRALSEENPAPAPPAFVAPRTPAEETLATLYAQVLGLEKVGVHDNFFDLGGGSIQILEIIARAESGGVHLAPDAFFEHQTVSEIAASLNQVQG